MSDDELIAQARSEKVIADSQSGYRGVDRDFLNAEISGMQARARELLAKHNARGLLEKLNLSRIPGTGK